MASFIRDESAAMEIPLRIVVYVIITAVILVITAIGLSNIKHVMTTDAMEKQIGDLKVSLNTIQYGATRNLIDPASPSGNLRSFKITLTDNIEYLAFGADPDPDNDGNLMNTEENMLTEKGNVIFYKSRTGSKNRVPLDDSIELREGFLDNGRWSLNNANDKQFGMVLTGSGKFEITFELVYDPVSKETYTLSHYTDDMNAYINPYDSTALPNSVWVSVIPDSVFADGANRATIFVQLKDKKGRDAARDGIEVNLTTTLGDLSPSNVTTVKGRGTAEISSNLSGTSLIIASAIGLNPGSTYLNLKQVPIILDIKKWINDSAPLVISFNTTQNHEYILYFSGRGTEALWEWPSAIIDIDGKTVGERIVDSNEIITKTFPDITLQGGTHNLSIRMTNHLYIPLIANRNLYVEKITLAEP